MSSNLPDLVADYCSSVATLEAGDFVGTITAQSALEAVVAGLDGAYSDTLKPVAAKALDVLNTLLDGNSADEDGAVQLLRSFGEVAEMVVINFVPIEDVTVPAALGGISANEAEKDRGDTETTMRLPAHADEQIFGDFVANHNQRLDEFESWVLDLEDSERSEASSQELKRYLHTLKGESGLLGLETIEHVCHEVETQLENTGLGPQSVEMLLAMKDWFVSAFKSLSGESVRVSPQDVVLDVVYGRKSPEVLKENAEIKSKPAPVQPAPVAKAPTPAVKPVPKKAPPSNDDEPYFIKGPQGLVTEFISESREHLDAADVQLLALETEPENPSAIDAIFRGFHTIKGVAGALGLRDINNLAHEAENLLVRARNGELLLANAAIDAVFDSVDMLKRLIDHVQDSLSTGDAVGREEGLRNLIERLQRIDAADTEDTEPNDTHFSSKDPIGDRLIKTGVARETDVRSALELQANLPKATAKIGELLVHEGKVTAKQIARALRGKDPKGGISTDEHVEKQRQREVDKDSRPVPRKAVTVREAVKVDAERLDRLIETVGELVIAESMVTGSPELRSVASAGLSRHLTQLDKITRELQDMAMGLRMTPIRPTFQKMARLVRDLSKKSGKNLRFISHGDETELDKAVVDKIGDPLVHMVRNSCDHGIEPDVNDRIKLGKAEYGTVELSAFHKGGSIHIEVKDDGRGLNKDAIYKKAVERGLIEAGAQLADRDLFNLVFEPGFSTAKEITDVSGRGVGMDVVRKNIESLRGSIEIASEIGVGTTVTIRLPLTLAIIDGMVVRVGEERYIIPTLSIVTSIRPTQEHLTTAMGRATMLSLQGASIPLYRLGNVLNVKAYEERVTESVVVIVEDEGRKTGLACDEILGQHQIVIKPLGAALKNLRGIAGGAIMPDGQVGLILDVSGLLKIAAKVREKQMQNAPSKKTERADAENERVGSARGVQAREGK